MAVVTWGALAAEVSYLSTGLNAQANAASVLGAAINNSAGHIWAMLHLTLATQGTARVAGARVDVYAVKSSDGGTTYEYGDATILPPASSLLGTFALDAAVTARQVMIVAQIPPGFFKLLLNNQTGQAFAATSTVLLYAFFDESVA